MNRLPSGIILSLASLPACAQPAVAGEPGSDSNFVVWVLVGVFVFFAIVVVFTWQLIKPNRKQQAENRENKQ